MTDLNEVDVVKTVVIGTGSGTGDGKSIVGVTKGELPNIAAQVIGPMLAVFIRFGKNFLVGFSSTGFGTFLAGYAPASTSSDSVVSVMQHLDLHLVILLALIPAVGGVVKDLITIFTGLEQKYPLAGV